jgi:hypothetical protein
MNWVNISNHIRFERKQIEMVIFLIEQEMYILNYALRALKSYQRNLVFSHYKESAAINN